MQLLKLAVLASAMASLGCSGINGREKPVRYETIKADPHRDTLAAKQLNAQAIDALLECELDEAIELANQALVCDVNYGPAHNTLGRIYFQQKKLYLAAWEFEHAGRLMPDRAEPISNQGLVYESATQLERASEFFTTALSLEPQNKEIIANVARVRHKMGLKDVETERLLKETILRHDNGRVADWAREKAATLHEEKPSEFGVGLDDFEVPETPAGRPLDAPAVEPDLPRVPPALPPSPAQ